MRKELKLALMASPVIATFLSITTPYLQAEPGARSAATVITPTTDDSGRKIYVNDSIQIMPSRRTPAALGRRSSLAYWSATEHRWKTVRAANVRAAQSAAAEVNEYLGQSSGAVQVSNFVRRRAFSDREIEAAIDQAASRHNVDPSLVRAVIKVESNFNPNAVSRKGAMGLMQLMPQTARQLKVTNPFDPEQNVDAGVRHLKMLMENYGGDVSLSLAAYNAGAGAVARSAGVPRFAETRNYVNRITKLYYGGGPKGTQILGNPLRQPLLMQRDARGVLYVSNTD